MTIGRRAALVAHCQIGFAWFHQHDFHSLRLVSPRVHLDFVSDCVATGQVVRIDNVLTVHTYVITT